MVPERQGESGGQSQLTPGRHIMLRARHPLGVPVHSQRGSHEVSGRLPDGSQVLLVSVDVERHWLEIETGAGRAFIVAKYVANGRGGALGASDPGAESGLEACRRRLAAKGAVMRQKASGGRTRIGTFNVRWFPDGGPGKLPKGEGTDVLWVACEIAELKAEVVALQEFKTTLRAREASEVLRAELDRLTEGSWQIVFDDCPQLAGLHVGLLYDSQRARLERSWVEGSLNPLGSACEGALRPGLSGDFVFSAGGQARVTSVHLKSGTDRRSFELRRKTFGAVAALPMVTRTGAPGEQTQVIAGDWNTMGCADCSPPVPAARERELLAQTLAAGGLTLVETALGCSHFHRGVPGLLDGFAVERRRDQSASSSAFGLCRQASCQPVRRGELVFERVSDHCPLALDWGGLRTSALPSSLPAQ